MEPSVRKRRILSAIVESYINTGEPVGSKTLIAKTGIEASSATVRNDMAQLTNLGYIVQPHTSAGRIPTPLGYRFYVDNMMQVKPILQQGREYINSRLCECADSPENILNAAADLLAELTDCTAFATTPNGDDSRVRRISFVQTGAHTAMAVLMASNGVIKTKLFRCEFVITPEILDVFDKALNELCTGVKLSSVNKPFVQSAAAKFGELSLLMPNVLVAIWEAAQNACQVSVCRSGLTKLLLMPDLSVVMIRQLVDFLKNDRDLSSMLEKLPIDTSVLIGRENGRVELAANTLISTRYMIDGVPSGVLAVTGPIRLNYARTISVLECVAECAGEIIEGLIEI